MWLEKYRTIRHYDGGDGRGAGVELESGWDLVELPVTMMAVVRVERYESIRHYDGEDGRGAEVGLGSDGKLGLSGAPSP